MRLRSVADRRAERCSSKRAQRATRRPRRRGVQLRVARSSSWLLSANEHDALHPEVLVNAAHVPVCPTGAEYVGEVRPGVEDRRPLYTGNAPGNLSEGD